MGYPTRVHVSLNDSVIVNYPVFVTATQQKGKFNDKLIFMSLLCPTAGQRSTLFFVLCALMANYGLNLVKKTTKTLVLFLLFKTNVLKLAEPKMFLPCSCSYIFIYEV